MTRIPLKYETIMERTVMFIRTETDDIFDMDEKEKAETAMRISAVLDFLDVLDHASVAVGKEYQE